MAKGFSKKDEDGIWVESLVKSRAAPQIPQGSLDPAVNLKWGNHEAQFSSQEARNHAFGILEAAASAEMDAALTRWAVQKLKLTPERAAQILMLFRQKRETGQTPSCTMSLGDEHIRPDTAKRRAMYLLFNAFNTEMEAFLAMFLLQDLERDAEVVDILIQEFREIRGLQTDWNVVEDDRHDS